MFESLVVELVNVVLDETVEFPLIVVALALFVVFADSFVVVKLLVVVKFPLALVVFPTLVVFELDNVVVTKAEAAFVPEAVTSFDPVEEAAKVVLLEVVVTKGPPALVIVVVGAPVAVEAPPAFVNEVVAAPDFVVLIAPVTDWVVC